MTAPDPRANAGEIDIEAIEARANAATSGEWRIAESKWNLKNKPWRGAVGIENELYLAVPSLAAWFTRGNPDDPIFVANARADVLALLAEVRRLRAALAAADAIRDSEDEVEVVAMAVAACVHSNEPDFLDRRIARAAISAIDGNVSDRRRSEQLATDAHEDASAIRSLKRTAQENG